MISTELQRIIQAKADIVTSIENKGVTVPAGTKIDDLDDYVDQIQGGGGDEEWTEEEMFTIKALSNGTIVFSPSNVSSSGSIKMNDKFIYIYYKVNNGQWNKYRLHDLDSTNYNTPYFTINVQTNDIIKMYGENLDLIPGGHVIGFRYSTAQHEVYGNLASLLSIKKTKTLNVDAFNYLFYYDEWLINAENLIIDFPDKPTSLFSYRWQSTFSGCGRLTKAPKVWNTWIYDRDFVGTFGYCGSLTTLPEWRFYSDTTGSSSYGLFNQAALSSCSKMGRTFRGEFLCDIIDIGYLYYMKTSTKYNAVNCCVMGLPLYRVSNTAETLPWCSTTAYKVANRICYIDIARTTPVEEILRLLPGCTELVFEDKQTGKYYLQDKTTECDEYGVPVDPNYVETKEWFSIQATEYNPYSGENPMINLGIYTQINEVMASLDKVNWYVLSTMGVTGGFYLFDKTNETCNKIYIAVNKNVINSTYLALSADKSKRFNIYKNGWNSNVTHYLRISGDIESVWNGSLHNESVYNYNYYMFGCSFGNDSNLVKNISVDGITINNAIGNYSFFGFNNGNTDPTGVKNSLPTNITIKARKAGDYALSYLYMTHQDAVDVTYPSTLTFDYVGSYGIAYMFRCTSISTLPTITLTNGLVNNVFSNMFFGCTKITTIPSGYLPWTELKESCYSSMFQGCTSLVNVPSNLLPATTLAVTCYQRMFQGCTSLITAPDLPALLLTQSGCYNYMFMSCSSLSTIKAAFFTSPTTTYVNNWVSGVSATGNYYKNKYATYTTTGVSGIPSGWNVIDYEGGNPDYFYLESLENGSTAMYTNVSNTAVWYWSKNLNDWYTWSADTAVTVNLGEKLYVKGDGANWGTSTSNYKYFILTGQFNAGGDIRSLTSENSIINNITSLPAVLGYRLFYNCTALRSIANLKINYTNPNSKSAFQYIFQGCTNLSDFMTVTLPYYSNILYGMYTGCTSLPAYCPIDELWIQPSNSQIQDYTFSGSSVRRIKCINFGVVPNTNKIGLQTNYEILLPPTYSFTPNQYSTVLRTTMNAYINKNSYTLNFNINDWAANGTKEWSGYIPLTNGSVLQFDVSNPVYINGTLINDFFTNGYTATQNYTSITVEMTQVNSEWVYQVTLS